MECPICHFSYKKHTNAPLLLITCGHTICYSCASKIFNGVSIKCPECNSESLVTSINDLPKNFALLAMFQSIPQSPSEECLCKYHDKRIEAFCFKDFTLLCIDCILLGNHKSHDIKSIDEAYESKLKNMQDDMMNINKIEDQLNTKLTEIEDIRAEFTKKAKEGIRTIEAIFKEIIIIITGRENTLKENIESTLEKELNTLKSIETKMKEQLNYTKLIRNAEIEMQRENQCEFLLKVKERNDLLIEANANIPNITINNPFMEIKKEDELTALWKLLSPQCTIRPNFYATTTSYANKISTRPHTSNKKKSIPVANLNATPNKLRVKKALNTNCRSVVANTIRANNKIPPSITVVPTNNIPATNREIIQGDNLAATQITPHSILKEKRESYKKQKTTDLDTLKEITMNGALNHTLNETNRPPKKPEDMFISSIKERKSAASSINTTINVCDELINPQTIYVFCNFLNITNSWMWRYWTL